MDVTVQSQLQRKDTVPNKIRATAFSVFSFPRVELSFEVGDKLEPKSRYEHRNSWIRALAGEWGKPTR